MAASEKRFERSAAVERLERFERERSDMKERQRSDIKERERSDKIDRERCDIQLPCAAKSC